MSELSRLLSSALAGQGVREVAESAQAHGHQLSPGTVSKYLNGRHGRPSESTLKAFSDALGIDLMQLRDAAGLPSGEAEPYVPPAESARLTSRQRDALDALIQSIVTTERGGEHAKRSAPMNHAPVSGVEDEQGLGEESLPVETERGRDG